MKSLPRINGPIFDSGHNFTPDEFPRAWDMTMDELEASRGGTSGSSSSGAGFDLALWGCGRVAGADFFTGDSAKIALPGSPSLALLLPAAVYYVADADGGVHRFDATTRTVLGVPPLLDEQCGHLRAVEVEDGDGEWDLELFGWASAPDGAKIAAGFPCVGVVSSDADAVTDVSSAEATVIWPQPLVQLILQSLVKSGGTGEETGGETGGSGARAATQLPITLTDSNDTKSYIDERDSKLEKQLEDVKASLGIDSPLATRLSGRVEKLREAHSGLLCDVVPMSPRAALHQESGVVVPGLAGMGETFADGTTGKTSYVGGNLIEDIPNRRLI